MPLLINTAKFCFCLAEYPPGSVVDCSFTGFGFNSNISSENITQCTSINMTTFPLHQPMFEVKLTQAVHSIKLLHLESTASVEVEPVA